MATTKPAAPQDDYAWANYLIYMEAGAELPWPVETPISYSIWYGAGLSAALAAVAYLAVAMLPKGIEPVTVVLPLGIAIGNLFAIPAKFRTGIRYALKTVLMVGIILLGARLNFSDVLHTGGEAVVLSAVQVVLMFALAFLIGRVMKIAPKQATLLGIGTAICGGSAIIATAPVIEAEERDVAFAVATVSFLGLAAMLILPLIGHAIQMDPHSFGVWAGLAIHQTPQVVAAGLAYHPDAAEAATLVKLARVSLLAPLVVFLSLLYRKPGGTRKRMTLTDFLPPMVAGFLLLAFFHSLGLIPRLDVKFPRWQSIPVDLTDLMKTVSGFAIATGMAAVGLETSLRSLRNIGMRPVLAGLLLAIAGVAFSFAAVRVFAV